MSLLAYWSSNFVIDFSKYMFTSILTFGLAYVFNLDFWLHGDKLINFVLLLILNGFAFIPFIYFISFFFRKPNKAQIFIFLMNFFFGMVFVIICFSLRGVKETKYLADNYLSFILRVIPFYCFGNGIFTSS
jgi:hypothetical protein